MFVHFERWTSPVLTTWMYAWQNRKVIDAHDKLLIHFQILVDLEPKKKKKKNRIVWKFATWATQTNPLPLLYNGVMKHGSWPYVHDKSLIQWIILFFVLVQAPRVYIHRKQFFIKYYRTSALPLLGWGKCKFHDNEYFTNHAIIWEFPFNLCKISFINNMTRMIEII